MPPPVVLIVSDDPRLKPFGPGIEYNGRDACEFGACGSVVGVLDASSSPAPSSSSSSSSGGSSRSSSKEEETGLFVFNLGARFEAEHGPEELAAATENTTELVLRLEAAAKTRQKLQQQQQTDNEVSEDKAASSSDGGSSSSSSGGGGDRRRNSHRQQHSHRSSGGGSGGREARSASAARRLAGAKKSVAQIIGAVGNGGIYVDPAAAQAQAVTAEAEAEAAGGSPQQQQQQPTTTLPPQVIDQALTCVDLSAQAVYQMKSDEKTYELCNALVKPNAFPVMVLKLRDCNLGDKAAGMIGEVNRVQLVKSEK
jgi:hypothetical protein